MESDRGGRCSSWSVETGVAGSERKCPMLLPNVPRLKGLATVVEDRQDRPLKKQSKDDYTQAEAWRPHCYQP